MRCYCEHPTCCPRDVQLSVGLSVTRRHRRILISQNCRQFANGGSKPKGYMLIRGGCIVGHQCLSSACEKEIARTPLSKAGRPFFRELHWRRTASESSSYNGIQSKSVQFVLYPRQDTMMLSRGARAAARSSSRFTRCQPRRFDSHQAGHGESALHVAGGTGNESFGVRL